MKRWYNDKEKALEAARRSGYPLWRVQKRVKVQHGTRWSIERRPSGDPRYYVGFEPPAYTKSPKYEVCELSKTSF